MTKLYKVVLNVEALADAEMYETNDFLERLPKTGTIFRKVEVAEIQQVETPVLNHNPISIHKEQEHSVGRKIPRPQESTISKSGRQSGK